MIVNVGYLPHTVAAITFTNKPLRKCRSASPNAAQTANARADDLHVPFFGHEDSARRGEPYRLQKNFSILDSTDSAKIIGELLGGTGKKPYSRRSTRFPFGKRFKNA
ncbi:ATP-dependent DNA helicase [Neisseria gonorrhoeae]|uniref:ATP-dependent DNA helicase n=1 Tax=Neisseria gonorrhoeae TaxID=485 RepID=A0A378VYR6_NEIGO|nr:ATP-dependent DNA helicase [Neisseria gonorrhoeae]